jgi:hypothetical protein
MYDSDFEERDVTERRAEELAISEERLRKLELGEDNDTIETNTQTDERANERDNLVQSVNEIPHFLTEQQLDLGIESNSAALSKNFRNMNYAKFKIYSIFDQALEENYKRGYFYRSSRSYDQALKTVTLLSEIAQTSEHPLRCLKYLDEHFLNLYRDNETLTAVKDRVSKLKPTSIDVIVRCFRTKSKEYDYAPFFNVSGLCWRQAVKRGQMLREE